MLDFDREAAVTLDRLLPRAQAILDSQDFVLFEQRMADHFPRLFRLLAQIYGQHYDFFFHLEQITLILARALQERTVPLRKLDSMRTAQPEWFKGSSTVGGVLYVDLFNGTLAGVHEKIPHFKRLGLTYLHLMPLFKAPKANSDGGYAISDFRQVNPALGTMAELAELTASLRAEGISLVLDFVFNHTSDEHEWVQRALDGEEHFQAYYFTFPDRTEPDQYQPMLRDIFPEQSPGSFTYRADIDRWVWTTFNSFQWDLNYRNPDVFGAMLGEMLFLANQGVEVLRLDAVAFIWKQLGTTCENLPQVHTIIQAFNACARIAAPALLFKSEAIVHPDDVVSYVSADEAQLSYNPTFMASLWEALATRDVTLLRYAMEHRFGLPEGCTWINYIRCHDDIGWSFADEDARAVGINGYDHRQFLNRFYTGQHEGSFAAGLRFNYNPQNQDMRICGSAASLAGLEQALQLGIKSWVEAAVRRDLMLHGIIIAAGGVPLLYSGDEIAQLNDYSFRAVPGKANDERWVHRAPFDWARLADAEHQPESPHGQVWHGLLRMIALRKANPAYFDDETTHFFDTYNRSVLGFVRNEHLLVLANFSDFQQTVPLDALADHWIHRLAARNLITGQVIDLSQSLTLEPQTLYWLIAEPL